MTPTLSEAPTDTHAPADAPVSWHTLSVDDALVRQQSASTGLAGAEAAQRLKKHGPNELQAVRRESAWHVLGRAVPERR